MSRALFMLAALAAVAAVASAAVRGVPPSKHGAYDSSTHFDCLDGSGRLELSQVNDDYCDCKDGSDEPGTSACPNGRFYCANKGFRPLLLPSSRINDGVCDCCDGSDEYALVVQCVNTCDEDGREAREAARLAHDLQRKGYATKLEYMEEGKRIRQEQTEAVSSLEAAVEELRQRADALAEEKKVVEEPEKEAKTKFDEQWEASKKELEEKAKRSLFDVIDADNDGTITLLDMVKRQELDSDSDGTVTSEEAQQHLDVDGDGELSEEEISHDFESFCKNVYDEISNLFEDTEGVEDMPGKRDKPAYDESIQALIDRANEAREKHSEAERSKRDKERELADMNARLKANVGPNLEFVKLQGTCHEFVDREYKYKICPFDKATQEPKNGGRGTNLGKWGTWVTDAAGNEHGKMKFENGEKCWNGPNRSMTVNLVCGAENALANVAEPNRCEYTATLTTPAACEEPPAEAPEPFGSHDEL